MARTGARRWGAVCSLLRMRKANIRSGAFRGQTSGLAAGFVQVLRRPALPVCSVRGEPHCNDLTPERIPTAPHRSATVCPSRATSPSTFSCFASCAPAAVRQRLAGPAALCPRPHRRS